MHDGRRLPGPPEFRQKLETFLAQVTRPSLHDRQVASWISLRLSIVSFLSPRPACLRQEAVHPIRLATMPHEDIPESFSRMARDSLVLHAVSTNRHGHSCIRGMRISATIRAATATSFQWDRMTILSLAITRRGAEVELSEREATFRRRLPSTLQQDKGTNSIGKKNATVYSFRNASETE
jgi:hypothetical protein